MGPKKVRSKMCLQLYLYLHQYSLYQQRALFLYAISSCCYQYHVRNHYIRLNGLLKPLCRPMLVSPILQLADATSSTLRFSTQMCSFQQMIPNAGLLLKAPHFLSHATIVYGWNVYLFQLVFNHYGSMVTMLSRSQHPRCRKSSLQKITGKMCTTGLQFK